MKQATVFLAIGTLFLAFEVSPQEIETLKVALVALTDEPDLRAQFEDGLAAKARERDYDAVPSHQIVPDVADIDNRRFVRRLNDEGVGVVLMMRPAAVGAGSSIAAVRNDVSTDVYTNMRRFAREVSPSAGDDLFAVIHLGIYLLDSEGPELLSAGAVWLEEEADNQDEAIDLLQNLVLTNADAVRGPIREHIGLPPIQ